MIIIPILLVFQMHIGPTMFLEDSAPNTKFDVDKKLCLKSTNLD